MISVTTTLCSLAVVLMNLLYFIFSFSQSSMKNFVFLSMNSFTGSPAVSAAWTFVCAFSSTPVRKKTFSPCCLCHLAIVSVRIFSKA